MGFVDYVIRLFEATDAEREISAGHFMAKPHVIDGWTVTGMPHAAARELERNGKLTWEQWQDFIRRLIKAVENAHMFPRDCEANVSSKKLKLRVAMNINKRIKEFRPITVLDYSMMPKADDRKIVMESLEEDITIVLTSLNPVL